MKRKLAVTILTAIMSVCLGAGVFVGCKKKSDDNSGSQSNPSVSQLDKFVTDYKTSARQGYETEILGTCPRNIPKSTDNGGLATGYPVYGYTLGGVTTEQKEAIIGESDALTAKPTGSCGTYDKMDAEGNLFLSDGTPVNNSSNKGKLYKHSAAVGMYGGDVSDSEPAVIKRITFAPRAHAYGYGVTGLYAPAGEVVKVEIPKADLEAAGGTVTVHIGQALYNGQANNIWSARNLVRMPVILNTMQIKAANATLNAAEDTYTCYIGSYLGGPIYVRNTTVPVTITFSGAVQYRHFILGKTTEEEFNELCKSTAPYFDLEVWENGVLHSGPLSQAKRFSYEDLYNVAILWEKISLVSTQRSKQCIVGIYDPFVAAGAAVAFPGRSSMNCPVSWMSSALDYETFINSGMWGVIHEYNHNFQGWGLPGGGEVTNNAFSLASYAQFTRISASRTLNASGDAGLSGWNAYTNASWALKRVLARQYDSTNQLCIYATLIHNIGQEAFVRATNANGTTNYYKRLCEVSGYDMTYYFRELIAQDPGDKAVAEVRAQSKPAFVPVASIYQTGRSVVDPNGGKKYITTMQPFKIKTGEEYDLNFNRYAIDDDDGAWTGGTLVLPEGFSYTIKRVTQPESGRVVRKSDNVYTYTPGDKTKSGKFYVTLGITKDDGAFTVGDVELVIELEQTRDFDKLLLERTVYTYDANVYSSAAAAYEAGYDGYTAVRTEDNTNPTQNSNTDIWGPNPTDKAVMEVRGKIYVPTEGDYRIALRGRQSCALYISLDNGKTYTQAAAFNSSTDDPSFILNEDRYTDLKNLHAGSWVYFKEVLLVKTADGRKQPFIGLGWGRFEQTGGTLNDNGEYVDESGNVIEPTMTVNLAYANAYRCSYEFPEDEGFETDYLFDREHNFDLNFDEKGTLLNASGYMPWPNAGYKENLGELFDDDDNNYIHSNKGAQYDISEDNPFDITVDLGKEMLVSVMTIYGEPSRLYLPKNFVLYGGTDVNDMHVLATVTDAQRTGNNIIVPFDRQTIRYYRFVCTATLKSGEPVGSRYIAYRCIKFSCPFGTKIAPEQAEYYGNWSVGYELSSYGRVYNGTAGSEVEFEFTGEMFALLCANAEQADFDLYIDGVKVSGAYAGLNPAEKGLAFLSEILEQGKHSVKIVLKSDVAIDSFVTW